MYVGGYIITVCFTCKDSDSFSNFVNFSRNKDLLKTDDLHLGFQKLMTASIKCARPTGRMYSKFISPGVRYFKRCVGLLVNMRKMSIYEIFKKISTWPNCISRHVTIQKKHLAFVARCYRISTFLSDHYWAIS